MESILTSIKKLLGPGAEDQHFDPDIIMHINTVFVDLNDIGVGPEKVFSIEDDTSTWDEFIGRNDDFASVKTYMYLRVKLLFDPPTNPSVLASMEKQADKYEWKLNVRTENEQNN